MALELEVLNIASAINDVAQVANVAKNEEIPAWLGGVIGMGVVMTGLAVLWLASEITGIYFKNQQAKGKTSPGKSEAAPKAPAAVQVSAAASDDIPLAVIIAAAVQMVQAPIRNVVVSAPGMADSTWSAQGRQAIYASHNAKAPQAVTSLGTIRKK
jgi:Na+-transporting methylmalonyl-CoA/oxaloacetate decarboxylase gamma subunit